ncbi:MAG: hypothetical protein IJZ46_04365 [Bacilli bacterium]|nr:hypothetical protein [Bacilli bacterium]
MKLYINGSPKINNSNSNYFLNKININDNIRYLYRDSFDDILKNIRRIDTIIFCFPLYVDGPPSKVIEFMEYIEDNNISLKNKNIYVICNCGFLESKQNDIAVDIMKNFCIKNKGVFKGFFKIGAGEIIGKCEKNRLFKLISIPFMIKINKFRKCVDNNKIVELSTTIRPITKRLYILLANFHWKKKMIKNNCYKKEDNYI